jgi:hypothetical protein
MNALTHSGRPAAVNGDIATSLPDLQSKKTLVLFYKPIILSVDLKTCKTEADMLNAVRSQAQFEPYDMNVFKDRYYPSLVPGPHFTHEQLEAIQEGWPRFHFPTLNIIPRPRDKYDVQIYNPRVKHRSGDSMSFTVKVAFEDTAANLRDAIKEQTGIPTSSQRLDFQGRTLLASDHLLMHKMTEGSHVMLTVKTTYRFCLRGWTTSVSDFPDTQLYDILRCFAENERHDLTTLLFRIFNPFGNAGQGSEIWLPDRTRLLGAEEAKGTIEQNGIQAGNLIEVFELNKPAGPKRGLEENQETIESARKRTCAATSTKRGSQGAK